MKTNSTTFLTKKWQLLLLATIVSIVLGTGGYFYYSYLAGQLRAEKEIELKAIAELKTEQLVQWHKERIADAKVISESPFFSKGVEDWLDKRISKQLEEDIFEQLNSAKINFGYEDIFLISARGDILLSNSQSEKICEPQIISDIIEASRNGKITFTDFYFCPHHNKIHYDIIAPIKNNSNRIIANLIFRVDPYDYLYPLIQSWHTPSKSAEVLLVKKDGDSVLYLNELRHKKNTALQLRIPLTRTDLPATQAILGKTGIFDGKDYRGIDVVANLSPVTGTDWFMVSKVDKDEIFAGLNFIASIVFIVTVLLILALTIGMVWIYYYRQRNVYRNLWQVQEEFRATLYSIGDGVISTDINGFIVNMNPIAEKLCGWSLTEANGKHLNEVFKIINADTREPVINPVQLVLEKGEIVGLANHTVLISKNGIEYQIADSAAPIKNKEGEISGVVLVFSDVTEKYAAQLAIKQSEERFRLVAIQTGQLIYDYDIVTGNIFWNGAIEKVTGYLPEEFSAVNIDRWGEMIHPDDRQSVFDLLDEAISSASNYNIEYRFKCKDGRYIMVSDSGGFMLDANGKAYRMLGTMSDITERKRAEAKLSLQSAMIEASANAIVITDNKGIIQWANPAFTALTGYMIPDEVFGLNPRDLVKSRKQDQKFYENLWNTIIGGNIWHGELINRRKDGSFYNEEMTITPVKNEKGEIANFIAIKQDISYRKRAEEELRNAQNLYKSFFDDDLTGDVISTPDGEILTCNPAFAHLFGFSSVDEAKGVNIKTLYRNPNDRTALLERLKNKEIIKYIELEMKHRNGTPVFVVANFSGIFNEQGELVQIKGYLFDDTKRRTLEHQLIQTQKLESLGTLAAGIAHDFNNILGIIIGHASIFERMPATPDMIKKNTEAILKAGMRGASLVKQMLTFARKTDVHFEALSINDSVKEVSKLLNETFPKTITVTLNLENNLPLIKADATQVQQVILNLCVNARDAMPSSGTITITTQHESGSVLRTKYVKATAEDYIVLSVADTGIGMDEETQQRIFEPFFTTKEFGKGTGLGLSLVFGIMESHKGFVTVESKIGKGTTFHCYFPIEQQSIKSSSLEEQSAENIPGGSETILVIEDEEMLRELVKSVLESKGYKVLTAVDGEEGLAIFTQHKDEIRLVLSDFGLPKFSGDEVYRKLKLLKPDVLFILGSGFIEPKMKLEIMKLGVKEFIQKPYDIKQVLRIIRILLDKA